MSAIRFNRVKLNISGEIFETFEKTLTRYPETLLGNLENIKKHYSSRSKEYFFDRNRICFHAILYFYQSNGILSCPLGVDAEDFESECNYFMLPTATIHEMKTKGGVLIEEKQDDLALPETCQMKIWYLLEEPHTSQAASVYAKFSLFVILVSVVSSCLETIPELNSQANDLYTNPWLLLEFILNIWFMVELTGHFLCSPAKKKFCTNAMNIADFIAVVPYLMVSIFNRQSVKSVNFLRILRLVRIFRLLRLSKHSKRIKIAADIIKSSMEDLQILMLCLAIVIIFGGSFMYFVEDEKVFSSIPESMWWAVQTITTVGYGDITPVTTAGKVFSACFMAFGAITISLPVLSIVTKFTSYYSENV